MFAHAASVPAKFRKPCNKKPVNNRLFYSQRFTINPYITPANEIKHKTTIIEKAISGTKTAESAVSIGAEFISERTETRK